MARLRRRYRLAWKGRRANHGRKPSRGKHRYTFTKAGARPPGARR